VINDSQMGFTKKTRTQLLKSLWRHGIKKDCPLLSIS
jgi:hypothetical protein